MNARGSRVVVWLDPAAAQEASLQVLEGLAAGADPQILGLFVEDVNLLNVTSLSVAREITFAGAAGRQPERRTIEQQFRTHAARMHDLFEKAARTINARRSFRVARGELRAELLKTAAEFDTLVLAHSRREFGARLSTRAQLGELLRRGPRTVVVVQEQWRTGQSVAVLFDGSRQSEGALRMAAALAGSERLDLSVWLPEGESEDLQNRAEEVLDDTATAHFRSIASDDIQTIAWAAASENARALILPAPDPEVTSRMVPELLDRLSCSLVVVR